MKKVFLAEDHAMVREGLKLALLNETFGFLVVGEADDGTAVAAQVRDCAPDLLILDLELPGRPGLEVLEEIKALDSVPRILIVTGKLTSELAGVALAAGADGYVVKHADTDELLTAIHAVLAGQVYVSKHVAALFTPSEAASGQATERELQIMGMIAAGKSNNEIAETLHISFHTVRTHRKTLMAKLGLHNTAEISAYAIKLGLYSPD